MTFQSTEALSERVTQPAKSTQAHGQIPQKDRAWNKEQIRQARRTPLIPLLKRRGYRLTRRPNNNFLVEGEEGLVVKEFFWIWESHDMKGNAIDFFMLVECRSFHETMEILTQDE